MPPRNIRYADRAVIENLSWYYWVFNPIMIGLYGPLRTIIDLYFRYFYNCILLFTLITSLSTALWGLSSSVIDFIHHPMRRSRRLRFRSSLLLTKVAIILGLFHFVCFNAYISYLTVAPTLCWLDKNCRSFPAEVSAQTLAGIARAVTESMPFSSATYLSEEEVDPGARYSGTVEETKTRAGNSGRGETSNKDAMISLEHIPLSKTKEQPAANGNQGTKDLGGSKPTETLIDEKVELNHHQFSREGFSVRSLTISHHGAEYTLMWLS
ncbi:hypothetical protein DFP73DRAFT_616239 [Morchella snyderi]|nr:hypothetical protein DFP73DRAFT_616239 [Morchella snyderi]